MVTTIAEPKAAGLPDGLHHRRGVEYLAAAAGFRGDRLPSICIFDEEMGFSEITAFIRTSDGNGYYRTTVTTCTCPSFMYRGGPCKHQKRLAEELQKRAAGPSLPAGVVPLSSEDLEARRRRIAERNAKRAEEKARAPKPSTAPRGFNMPEEAEA